MAAPTQYEMAENMMALMQDINGRLAHQVIAAFREPSAGQLDGRIEAQKLFSESNIALQGRL